MTVEKEGNEGKRKEEGGGKDREKQAREPSASLGSFFLSDPLRHPFPSPKRRQQASRKRGRTRTTNAKRGPACCLLALFEALIQAQLSHQFQGRRAGQAEAKSSSCALNSSLQLVFSFHRPTHPPAAALAGSSRAITPSTPPAPAPPAAAAVLSSAPFSLIPVLPLAAALLGAPTGTAGALSAPPLVNVATVCAGTASTGTSTSDVKGQA